MSAKNSNLQDIFTQINMIGNINSKILGVANRDAKDKDTVVIENNSLNMRNIQTKDKLNNITKDNDNTNISIEESKRKVEEILKLNYKK